jgi:hypothetical protein
MRKLFTALALMGTLGLGACSTVSYNSEPVALLGQTLSYEKGVGTVANEGKGAIVRAKLVSVNSAAKEITYAVAIANSGEDSFNIGSENVSAGVEGGETLRVFSATEMEATAKKRAATAQFLVALGGALESASNNYSATSTSTYRSSTGYTATSTHTNPYLAARLNQDTNARTQANMQEVSALLAGKLGQIREETLQTTTVGPGQATAGLVVSGVPKTLASATAPVEVNLTVMVRGEPYKFRFKVTKAAY